MSGIRRPVTRRAAHPPVEERAARASLLRRLLSAAGRALHVEARPVAENLETRLLLAIFDPSGTNIGTLGQANLSLTRADRVIVDINPLAGGQRSDRINVTGNASLNGVLQLRLGNGGSLAAGDRFDVLGLTGGTIGGAFAAIEGLDANGAALDFVTIQGPNTLSIVATNLPTSDFTIRVNSASEAEDLIAFFAAGSTDGLNDEATATGAIYALGQHVHGVLTFTESTTGGTNIGIAVDDGGVDADKGRITTATTDGTNVYSVFGQPSFTLRGRAETASVRGLRLDSGFSPTGYSLGDSVVSVAPDSGLSGRLGPFSFVNVIPTLTGFVLADQAINIDAGIGAESLLLTFQSSGSVNPGGVTAEATTVTATFGVGLQYTGGAISRISGRGKFSISADEFVAEVPEVIRAEASGVMLGYDPDADRTQTLFSTNTLSIELPRLHLRGDVAPAPGSMDPGLVIRGDGFMFGSLTVTLDTGSFGSADPEGFLMVASFLRVKDPSFTITNFGMTFATNGAVSGASPDSINLSFGEVRMDLASGVNASGTDLSATMMLSPSGVPTGFELSASTIHFEVPGVVVADAEDVLLSYDPEGDRTQTLLSIGTMDIEMPKLHLAGRVEPAPGSMDPGLVIRGDGFLFGSLTITLNTDGIGSMPDPEGFLNVASFLKVKNPSFNITNFGMTFNADGTLAGASVGSISLGVAEFRIALAGGVMGSGTNIIATLTFDSNNVPNGYSLMASTLHFEVPGVVVADAEDVLLSYDPNGDRTQTLFSVGTMDIEMPKLHLSGRVEPAPGSMDPGLVIRGDGFLFGSLTITLNTDGIGSMPDPEGFLNVASFLKVKNPSFNITNFGMTFNANGTLAGASVGSISFGIEEFRVSLASGMMASGTDVVATLTFDSNNVPNGYSLMASTLHFEVPNMLTADAEDVLLAYDPNADRTQTLFSVSTMTIEVPRLHLRGDVAPAPGSMDPGLVIRGDGFHFGSLTVTLTTSSFGSAEMIEGDSYLKVGGFLRVSDPFVNVTDWGMTFNANGTLAGTVIGSISVGAAKLIVGNPTGSFNAKGTNLSATVTFGPNNVPNGFAFSAGTLGFKLGYVSVSGTGIVINPAAADDEYMLEVGTFQATLDLGAFFADSGNAGGAFTITGSAGNFAITGDGTFVPFDDVTPMPGNTETFFVTLDVDASNIGQLFSRSGAPSSLPAAGESGFMAHVGVQWPDLNNDPGRFLMTVDARLAGMVGPLMVSVTVEGLVFDSGKIRDGMFPIVGMSSIVGSASGTLGGAMFAGTIIVGLVQFDASGSPLPSAIAITPDNVDDVSDSVLYVGARAAVTLPNGWGVDLMFGFSELGFLQAYVRANVDIPIGNTGLVFAGFRGGITFNATALPDIEDPVDLRAPIFKAPSQLTDVQWEAALRRLVINQKGGNGGLLFEADEASGEDWTGSLDNEVDPGLYLPAGLRTEFLNAGVNVTRAANIGAIIALNPGNLWLMSDSGSEFLIEKNDLTGKFVVSRVNYSLDGGFIDQLPAQDVPAVAVTSIEFTDADGTHSLVDAFLAKRVTLSSSATIVNIDPGVWEITDPLPGGGAIKYTLRIKGDADNGVQVLVVEGGDAPMSAAGNSNSRIRIDAGFSLSSVGGSSAWRLDADAIVVIGATIQDVQIVLLGSLSVGPAASPTLKVDAKAYISFTNLPNDIQIFLLSDFFSPPVNSTPGDTNAAPQKAFFSVYGHATLTLPTAANGNTLGIRLTGSQTQGLAVFDTAGLTQGAFADQRVRLGGPSSPGGTDYGFVDLTFSNNKLEFAFDAKVSAEGIIDAASFIHASGRFVMNFTIVDILGDGSTIGHTADDILLPINLYGAAKFSASASQIKPLASAGVSGELLATLKINTSGISQTVVLGQDPNTEDVTIKPYSFAVFAGATLKFTPPGIGGVISQQIAGFFSLELSPEGFNLLVLGTGPVPLPVIGVLASPLQGDILGAFVLRRQDNGTPLDFSDDSFDMGGRLEIAVTTDPGIRQFIDFNLELRMYLNTSSENLEVSLPQDFMTRFAPSLSQSSLFQRLTFNPTTQLLTVVIPAGAPTVQFNPATYNPMSPGNQIDAPGAYIAIIGIGNFTIGNEDDFGVALEMSGNVRIKFGVNGTSPEFKLAIQASTNLAPLGTLTASGEITIVGQLDTSGPIPIPYFDTWGSFQLAGAINFGQLSIFAAVSVDINTSDSTKQVNHYYDPVTRLVIPITGTPISVDMDPGIRIFAGGGLRWNGTDLISGEFTFAATSQGLSMTVDAVLNLQPLANVTVTGSLDLYTSGDAVGFLLVDASAGADLGAVGFTLSGSAFLKINTLDSAQTLAAIPFAQGQNIAANSFEVYINGALNITMFGAANLLSLSGSFWLTNDSTALTLRAEASLSLFDFFQTGQPALSINVSGLAKVYKADRVLVMDIAINIADLGIPHLITFSVDNARFKLNTSSTPNDVRDGVARGLHIGGSVSLKVVGLTLATVNASIDYEPDALYAAANGAWHIAASLNVDFFGIITLNGSVDIYSRGAFRLSIAGGVNFGNDWFGASFSASMLLDFRAQNDGNGTQLDTSDLNITGSFSGEAHAGIKVWGVFIGVSLGAGGRFNYNGATREMTVYVFADFGDLIGEVGGTFSIGTLDFQAPPPPPRLAGPGVDAAWTAPATGGTLYLNVGAFAQYRNLSEGETTEQFSVEALGAGTNVGQRIRVSGFGLIQEYDNVTGIVADFADSNDYFFAGRAGATQQPGFVELSVPVTVTGGANNDTIIVRTTSTVNINGNGGNDYIEASGGGGTINAGEGDDTITWLARAESGVSLDGGTGANALQVFFTMAADRVLVDRPVTAGFNVKRLDELEVAFDTISAVNLQTLTLSAERGADIIDIADLTGSGVTKVIVDLSQYDTGATVNETVNGVITTRRVFASDEVADRLTIEGTSGADTVNLVTGPDALDFDGDNNTTEQMLAVNLPDDSPTALIRYKIFNSSRAFGDQVIYNGNGGADVINASAVAADLAALTINGGLGNDTITGSPFNDMLNAGADNNSVHGGEGQDIITAEGGNDTLYGDGGNDTVNAGDGTNFLYGNDGNDQLTSGSGVDLLDGGIGNDILSAGAGNDTLLAGDGNDSLNGGLGDDTYTGGLGQDAFTDAGGRDTLIEARGGDDLFISDDTFIVGTVLTAYRSLTGDQYSAVTEHENLRFIFEVASLTGGDGSNLLVVGDVDGKLRIGAGLFETAQLWSGQVDLIGGRGGDRYIVTVFGRGNAVINIVENISGAPGVDTLRVYGSNLVSSGETFLVRPNFIAALGVEVDSRRRNADRVNFTTAIEGGATVLGLLGDDSFILDDTAIPVTIEAGGGRDFVQIGQLFGAQRQTPYVAIGDGFGTTAVDLTPAGDPSGSIIGYLSNGASAPLTVNGGDGDDRMFVFRNVAVVNLNGDAGNDSFTVRSFALAGMSATTQVAGGGGADTIEYATNANVAIDGGDGLDSVRILGTQFGDTYTVTELGINGAGLSVSFTAVESLELHAGDGNDTVYVLGTPSGMRVSVFGGAGSDKFYVTGVAPGHAARPDTLTRIDGPLLFEGGPGDPTAFGLLTAILMVGERDRRLPPAAGSMQSQEQAGDVDTLDIINVDATADSSGSHAAAIWPEESGGLAVHTLSGFGLGSSLVQNGQTTPGGVSYRRLEIVDVQFGSGAESLLVSSVAANCTTVFRGNGGADHITITAAGVLNAMLVVFGDNAAGLNHTGAAAGDVLDASGASQAVTLYGGAGADTLLGGSAGDRLFGGSGIDIIGGGDGDDVILGDSGIDFDRATRVTTVRTGGMPALDNLELVGADIINPGNGADVVFGDHGRLTQEGNAPNVWDTTTPWQSIETTNVNIGSNDLISARKDANAAFNLASAPAIAGGNDLIFGGLGADTINAGSGDDTILGDHGKITFAAGAPSRIESTNPTLGSGEIIDGGDGDDRIIGGTGGDTIDAGVGNDVIFGDHGLFDFTLAANSNYTALFTGRNDAGAADTIYAGAGHDIALGQQGDDMLFGQDGDDDLYGGHNVAGGIDELDLAISVNDRIDGGLGNDVIAGDNAIIIRITGGGARFRTLTGAGIYASNGTLLIDGTARPDPRGVLIRTVTLLDHDTASLAAGGVFGDDQVAGGSGDDMIFGQLGNDLLRGDGVVSLLGSGAPLLASPIPANDGDDYIEGNGGIDTIWGDLGRDDLIGGSSSLFGLPLAAQRLDGSDLIFGGDGTRIARNDTGDTSATGHAHDSDYILGDNGNIFRLVSVSGSFLTFGYDNYSAALRLLPRGVQFLDYSPTNPGAAVGGADEIRGEAGDDTIHGMTGSDTLYGDAQDDDITGGLGDDWIFGGTGHDGLLGDDGVVSTARNGTAESLYGIGNAPAEVLSAASVISTTIFVAGELQKYATLHTYAVGGNDVIYSGLGNDFAHGGEGMDAISGAEALAAFYNPVGTRPTLVYSTSLRRFTQFDPGTGLRKIANFFLNFDASISNVRVDDGKDTLFGDHGHDWVVGGTNQDRIFGGMGDDVLNADDNLGTNSGLNFSADSGVYAEADLTFGGGGLDRLIANTAGDRLIDWVDDFNQYLTPFTQAYPTVITSPTVAIIAALRSLGRGGGADQLLIEPQGELGLVQTTDPEWSDQIGRPLSVETGPTVWVGDVDISRRHTRPAPRPMPPATFDLPSATELFRFNG